MYIQGETKFAKKVSICDSLLQKKEHIVYTIYPVLLILEIPATVKRLKK
jgi:hypothetical protein